MRIFPAILALLVGVAGAFAQEAMPTKPIPLPLVSTALGDPSSAPLWADYLKMVPPDPNQPNAAIWIARATVGKTQIVVTMLRTREWCGINQCAVRVFSDGKLTNDTILCDDPEAYALLPNGKSLVACDKIVELKASRP